MKLIKEMLVYTGTSVIEKIVPFLLLPLLTRALTPEDYGVGISFYGSCCFACAF